MFRQLTRKCSICHNVFINLIIDYFSKEKLIKNLCPKCKFEQRLFAPPINLFLSRYFNVAEGQGGIREIFSDLYVRKFILSLLNGLGKFGLNIPLTFGAPLAVTFNLTNLCNLRCPHCYQNAISSKLPTEVTTPEILSILHQLAEYGVAGMLFGGGEPLMHRDIFQILRTTIKLGMFANLSTNATLITEKIAQKIKDTGISRVTVSLDGVGKTHDKMRGKEGTFERTVQGIKNCKAIGMETGIAVTLTKYNVDEMPELVAFAKELNLAGILLNHFMPIGRGKENPDLDVSNEEREAVLRLFYKELVLASNTDSGIECFSGGAPFYTRIAYQTHVENGRKVIPVSMQTISTLDKRIHFHPYYLEKFSDLFYRIAPYIGACTVATSYSCIDPEGNVFPCTLIPITLGNLRTERFADIWERHPLLKELRNRKKLKGPCRDCRFYTCRGCRARAFAYKGDIFESDIACIECHRILEMKKQS